MSELQLQKSVATLLNVYLKKTEWCHVANERRCNFKIAQSLKSCGVKPGVPDILIFKEPRTAIELKYGKNNTNKNQEAWLDTLSENGWNTAVCWSVDEVESFLKKTGHFPK